jgi:hypothetical protein
MFIVQWVITQVDVAMDIAPIYPKWSSIMAKENPKDTNLPSILYNPHPYIYPYECP